MTCIFDPSEITSEELSSYVEAQDKLTNPSPEQRVGLIGENKTVHHLNSTLRRVFPYSFPLPRVEYAPDMNSPKPDIIVRVAKIVLWIEVKYWRFFGPITSYHVRDKVANKNWGNGVKLLLSVIPKQLTQAAALRLREAGIQYVNGLSNLMEAISNCLDTHIQRSFLPNVCCAPVFRACEKLCGRRAVAVVRYVWEGCEEGHFVCVGHAKVAEANNERIVVEYSPTVVVW